MDAIGSAPAAETLGARITGMPGSLMRWLRSHRATVSVAGLVAFAGPTTFFAGAVSVMAPLDASSVATLGGLFSLYGGLLWALLLLASYALFRMHLRRRVARSALAFILACLAVTAADSATAPRRGHINIEQGVVTNQRTMQLYSSTFSLAMALLFFAHLERGRAHGAAALRLASAQAAQRRLRQTAADARLKALQARIDPQLLFDMLDDVRRCYEADPLRAERGLDELVSFLRASLPRMRSTSSTLARECELARAYISLRCLLRSAKGSLAIRIAADAANARFPPGILVPLFDEALHSGLAASELVAACDGLDCCLVLTLPAYPSAAALARAQNVLLDLHAASCAMTCAPRADGGVELSIRIPHEAA